MGNPLRNQNNNNNNNNNNNGNNNNGDRGGDRDRDREFRREDRRDDRLRDDRREDRGNDRRYVPNRRRTCAVPYCIGCEECTLVGILYYTFCVIYLFMQLSVHWLNTLLCHCSLLTTGIVTGTETGMAGTREIERGGYWSSCKWNMIVLQH
jgi:hypothetical protein